MVTDTLTLRRATAEDAAKLALIGSATFLAAFAHDHPGDALVVHCRDQHSEARYATWAESPDAALWILETRLGAPIGYALLDKPALGMDTRPDDVELKRIYVLPGWQSGGQGQTLLDAVIAEARSRGAGRLLLCVYEANSRAQAFYLRQGFERVGTQIFMVGDTAFTDYVMALRLG